MLDQYATGRKAVGGANRRRRNAVLSSSGRQYNPCDHSMALSHCQLATSSLTGHLPAQSCRLSSLDLSRRSRAGLGHAVFFLCRAFCSFLVLFQGFHSTQTNCKNYIKKRISDSKPRKPRPLPVTHAKIGSKLTHIVPTKLLIVNLVHVQQ